MEKRIRSFIKSITWRVLAVINGFLIAYVFLNDFSKSLIIAVVGNITGFVLYYIHERIWNIIKWGKK